MPLREGVCFSSLNKKKGVEIGKCRIISEIENSRQKKKHFDENVGDEMHDAMLRLLSMFFVNVNVSLLSHWVPMGSGLAIVKSAAYHEQNMFASTLIFEYIMITQFPSLRSLKSCENFMRLFSSEVIAVNHAVLRGNRHGDNNSRYPCRHGSSQRGSAVDERKTRAQS